MSLLEISILYVLLCFGVAALTAVVAWRLGALNRSGVLAATLLGGVVFSMGSWPWAAMLLTFFISSSALSRLFKRQKRDVVQKYAKGERRDWAQVLANGGVGAFLVLLHLLYPGQLWPWLAYGGAMAAVTGDTWATELGVLSKNEPRLVSSGKRVERGTSGGVTLAGYLATLAGGLLIGLVMALTDGRSGWLAPMWIVPLAGVLGGTVDSLLGATVQAIYYDPEKGKETERQIPGGQLLRGWAWMNNDTVNFISALVGALLAAGLWLLIQ